MAKTIHIHLHSKPTHDAGSWEEGKHPRAENGQFGKGSGGGAAAKKSAPAKKPAGSNKTEHSPGTHQYHQAKADAMRGEHRPYGNEAGNLHISTLTHHQNAAHALKKLETAQGEEHRKQLKEQADFHMGKAAEGEKRLEELGHGKRPKKTTGFGFGGEKKPASSATPPTTLNHQGKSYVHTGKSGESLADGGKTHEYEEVKNGQRTGTRVWRHSVTGQVRED